ncbi:transposase [Hymenobacter sp. BT664]|uniref:Transposase n=1 Tax=Hymenobacter montanus TaxID=2771359 RepID=A0A927GI25_9BACT|nr:transposase [Hymenobacter montanus]MBD2767018.1 transposase [Hymenobacter montanus]
MVGDCRVGEKKSPCPSAVILDTQSVKNTPTSTQAVGFDAGKGIKGRKRLVVVDTLGNLLVAQVVSADPHDGAIGVAFWDRYGPAHPLLHAVQVAYVDGTFLGRFRDHLALAYQIRVEKPAQIVKQLTNFCLHQKRWIVERTIAWLNVNRRLSKDYERCTARASAWLYLANIRRILKFC